MVEIELKNKLESILNNIPVDFGGGCSMEKALVMAGLIKKYSLKVTLDIGVYRGRSLFPQAIAHAFFSKGKVYGVDPYSQDDAKQFDNPNLQQELDDFVKTTDFEQLYQDVVTIKKNNGLDEYVSLVRQQSDKASLFFEASQIRFDLIHIDGNHDTGFVMKDVELYLPLLNNNGFIVLDDISWDSVKPAYSKLNKELKRVFELRNKNNDFAVFWNGHGLFKNMQIKNAIKNIVTV